MKNLLKHAAALILLLATFNGFSQAQKNCAHCNMEVGDLKFKAQATTISGETRVYDAIECLVNEVKTKNIKTEYSSLLITDYNSQKLVQAQTSYYLISKSLRSPMGANLSGYSTKAEADKMQKTNKGDVLNWTELLLRFKDSRFGDMGHGHHHHHRPDMYGPAGIGGDHLHEKGGAMISVKHMVMRMQSISELGEDLTNEDVFQSYMVAPENMSMQMTMVGVMYAPTDKLTLMVMQGFISNQMSMQMKMMHGMHTMYTDFETSSQGIGDLNLSALVGLISRPNASVHANIGCSVPFGSVTITDKTPMAENAKLPYAMQIGSGTWDPKFGATYRGNTKKWSWGVQQMNTLRLGTNSEGYTLGNSNTLNSWLAVSLNQFVSTSFRIEGTHQAGIKGRDSDLNPMMAPMASGQNYERQLVRTHVGFNTLFLQNSLLIGAEVGLNIYQRNLSPFMNDKQIINGSIKYII